eukprot:NODE_623_length_5327_cov_0.695103.p1 type:complete len:948 gc:universal NODE_623_length_5327_cov_0.695103:645-3488(+)
MLNLFFFIWMAIVSCSKSLSTQEISDEYHSSSSYSPQFWEFYGGKFLNATNQNDGSTQLQIYNGDKTLNYYGLYTAFSGGAVFIGITLFSSLLFCCLAPFLACVCGCCKSRNSYSTNNGKFYERTATFLLVLCAIFYVCIATITGISGNTLTLSIETIKDSVGSVYSEGLSFTGDTKDTLESILIDLTRFARTEIGHFRNISINGMINSTQQRLTSLGVQLESEFAYGDTFVGNLSAEMIALDSEIKKVKVSLAEENSESDQIKANLTSLGTAAQSQIWYNVIYTAKNNPFPSFTYISNFDANTFPTNLRNSAYSLNQSKSAFSSHIGVITANLRSQLNDAEDHLRKTFDNFELKLNSSQQIMLDILNRSYITAISNANTKYAEYNTVTDKYHFNYTKYIFYGVLAFVLLNFMLFLGVMFCIASKKRRLAMSVASCLFAYAAIALMLSALTYIVAFVVSEGCNELYSNFPLLQNVSPQYSQYANAGVSIVNSCANNDPIDTIILKLPDIPGNSSQLLNISKQYDLLVGKLNLNQFTGSLDFSLTDLYNRTQLQDALRALHDMDLHDVDVANLIPTNGIDVSKLQQLSLSISFAAEAIDENSFNYQRIVNVTESSACVSDYVWNCHTQQNNTDALIQQISMTNMDLFYIRNLSASANKNRILLPDLMLNITEDLNDSFDKFNETLSSGKMGIISSVNKMPQDIKDVLESQFSILRNELQCQAMGQTIKVMEFNTCRKMLDALNGMWISLWILGYAIVITFVALNLGANILFRTIYEEDDIIKDKRLSNRPKSVAEDKKQSIKLATTIKATAVLEDIEPAIEPQIPLDNDINNLENVNSLTVDEKSDVSSIYEILEIIDLKIEADKRPSYSYDNSKIFQNEVVDPLIISNTKRQSLAMNSPVNISQIRNSIPPVFASISTSPPQNQSIYNDEEYQSDEADLISLEELKK